MKAHHRKRKTAFKLELTGHGKATAHGGQILLDAFCRRFNLWERLAKIPGLDPRTRKGAGYDAEALAAQLIFSLTSGGTCLADAERLGKDPILLASLGLDKAADQSTLGEWLRAQTDESIAGIFALIRAFVGEVLALAAPGRVRHIGELEAFFDDTELEVYGNKIEGARINYKGESALSWQVLWLGPFLLDQRLGDFATVAECQTQLLDANRALWKDTPNYFYADSGSSEGALLEHAAAAGFTRWSVSYNKWPAPLERIAGEQPEAVWGDPVERNGTVESYARIRHLPAGMKAAQTFAAARYKREGELFWRYAFVACENDDPRPPRQVFERHRLKGASEQRFSEVLSDLDLHHPPCLSLTANRAYYALAALAYNLLTAFKVLELGEEHQSWRVRSIIRHLLTLPAVCVRHANRMRLRISVPAGLLGWWRLFLERFVPRRKRGESTDEAYWSDGGTG